MRPTVLLLAGEASGDAHGARLAAALRSRREDLRFVGIGGPGMEAEGVELLAGLEDLAVMGFAEVIPRLPFFRTLLRRIEEVIDEAPLPLIVPIDFPGFNLRVARSARARGCKVLYYIAPKVWAWRPGRARTLAEVTDRVAVILPFEEPLLREAGVRAEYVGHPLLDRPVDAEDGAAFRARWRLAAERPLLAVLPGSRRQELERHLDLFVEAAKNVCAERTDVLPVLCRAPGLPSGVLERAGLPVVNDARALLRHSDAALVKSGTATLEAALERTPTVVAYRTSASTWWVARALMRTEHVALPNVIARGEVVPEYLQRAAEPTVLARALLRLLDPESPERRRQLEGLERVRAALGAVGDTNVSGTEAGEAGAGRARVAERVADMALDLMRTEA